MGGSRVRSDFNLLLPNTPPGVVAATWFNAVSALRLDFDRDMDPAFAGVATAWSVRRLGTLYSVPQIREWLTPRRLSLRDWASTTAAAGTQVWSYSSQTDGVRSVPGVLLPVQINTPF